MVTSSGQRTISDHPFVLLSTRGTGLDTGDWTEADLTGLVVVITDATSGRGLSGSQTLVADGAPKEMPRLRLL